MTEEEKKLIIQAQKDNLWAFEKLVRQYDRQCLSLAYQLTGNAEDAEDVYQEVMIRVFRNIKNYRFESDFFTWLYRIVVNCALTYRKSRNRNQHFSIHAQDDDDWEWIPVDTAPDPEKCALQNEIREKIDAMLDTLPLMQRVTFVLRFYQDFKIRDIAEITGCTIGTIKNHIFRVTQKMKKNLSILEVAS